MQRTLLIAVFSLASWMATGDKIGECGGEPVDLVFVLDSSSSIWPPDFKTQLKFVEDMVNDFDIGHGDKQTRVGVVTFSDGYYPQFHLNRYPDKSSVLKAIRDIRYRGGGTNTGKAIKYITEEMFTEERGSRKHTSHIAVVITDGQSQEAKKTAQAAADAKQRGIKMFAIGVGSGVDKKELKSIASEPASKYMFQVFDYRSLATIRKTLSFRTCEVTKMPTTIKITTPSTTESTTKPMTTSTTTETTTTPTTTSTTTEATTTRLTTVHLPVTTTTASGLDNMQGDSEMWTESCGGKPADVHFLLDSSSSVPPSDYLKQLQFVQEVIGNFDIGPDKTRVGVSTFSDIYRPTIGLDSYTDKKSLKAAVRSVPYLMGGTDTAKAIRNVREHGFSKRVARREVGHILIVLTDGISQDPEQTAIEAELAKKSGIYVFAIGIGSQADVSELKRIASKPSDRYAFQVSTFDALRSMREILAIRACAAADEPTKAKEETECGSGKDTDVLFVFDAARLGHLQTQIILQFISQVTSGFGSSGNIWVGVLSENCPNDTEISLSPDLYQWGINRRLVAPYTISPLLKRVRLSGFSSDNGGRRHASRRVVLFLDSFLDQQSLREAKRARIQHTEMFVVAVGDQVDMQQAQSICGRHSRTNIIPVPDYSYLLETAPRCNAMMCGRL